ncbi:MAG: pyridoxal phosphate-dependent aminotransferase [Prevotellaceae bacterium]|jgi:cystathionine beta-lyase|nr:pyridoxal phosphate-dependent aminotransferase [Prevotellaceae bacterium]
MMNNFNFDEIIPRRNTCSLKWDKAASDDVLPMWVADMDFRTAPAVLSALQKRVQHGVFGYTKVPDEFYRATTRWFARRYGFCFQEDKILYTSGVVAALTAVIKALTKAGNRILIQEPVYNCFFSVIKNNNCEVISNDLIYQNNQYTIDFEDFERKAADCDTAIFLLCNPHNPAGRVWTREELTRMGEICLKHKVLVISDEIHCDFVFAPHQHIAFASISEEFRHNSVTCIAPSKTFNLAGLKIANIYAENAEIRQKIDSALHANELHEISPFAVDALIAAYNHSETWLEALKIYLYKNYLFLKQYIATHLPQLKVTPLEATYLVWIECKALNINSKEIETLLFEQENLQVNAGTLYGAAGEGFIRINIACPRALLQRGLEKIRTVISN